MPAKKKGTRKRLTPAELDANYEKYMKGKELAEDGQMVFEQTVAYAATPVKGKDKPKKPAN